MPSTLAAWIGAADLRAAEGSDEGAGPIAGLLETSLGEHFSRVQLLGAGYSQTRLEAYCAWLRARQRHPQVRLYMTSIRPDQVTDYARLLAAATEAVRRARDELPENSVAYHLTPGTPAMTVIFVLLSQTKFPGETYQSYFDPESRRQRAEKVALTPIWLSVVEGILTAESRAQARPSSARLVSRDAGFERAVREVQLAASATDAAILLCGETGTGKEALARLAHESSGARGEFVAVNCGAIPPELFESTMFGHRRGAFTGATHDNPGACEQAHNGTLFLDEICDLRPEHQTKLLRALQPIGGAYEIARVGQVRVRRLRFRVVSASNRDLRQLVWQGAFREDLYFRISTLEIHVPPLRQRPDDVRAFVEEAAADLLADVFRAHAGRAPRPISRDALDFLVRECSWPGNFRSLQRVLIRLNLNVTDAPISRDEAVAATSDLRRPADESWKVLETIPLSEYAQTIRFVQTAFLQRAYRAAQGNKERAARLLGLATGTVFRETAARLGISFRVPMESAGDAQQAPSARAADSTARD